MRAFRTGSAIALGCVTVAAAGVAVGLLLAPPEAPAELDAATTEQTVATSTQQFDDRRTVPVTLHVTEAATLRTAATGVVTEVTLGPTGELTSGDAPFDVNGEPVVALHTSVPIYRDLTAGDRGIDVKALQSELGRLGYTVDVNGKYGPQTTAAVKALQKREGMTKPSGSIALTQIVWIPATAVTPETWTPTLGGSIAGDLGTLPAALTAVTVANVATGLAPGERTLEIFGQSTVLDANNASADPTFLAEAMASAEYRAVRQSDTPDQATASIALTTPLTTIRVPPAAVFGIEGTQACVQVDGEPVPVTIVGSGLGASLVTVEGEPPTEVDLGSAITASGCR
jgi:peptidoglycan hydrolase-like protein with peptidoglycan-binding domain